MTISLNEKHADPVYAAVPEYLSSRCDFIQYRTYRSCRTVGALISQNQIIKLDLHTGILFFCSKNARKIPDNTSVQPYTTW